MQSFYPSHNRISAVIPKPIMEFFQQSQAKKKKKKEKLEKLLGDKIAKEYHKTAL